MITVFVELETSLSPGTMINRIWSGAEWKRGGSGIKGLAIEYDDGQHQSVQVCVGWRDSHMALSIMRFRDSASRISFFFSRPPQGIAEQTGVWEASVSSTGCRLQLARTLQLERRPAESQVAFHERERAYGNMLRENTGRILDALVNPD